MCLECLRTCPHDNIGLNLRAFGIDLELPSGRRLDEAFKAGLMLGSALVYSAVMLGPWGALKLAAYAVGSWPWLAYAGGFLAFVFGLLPGLLLLAVAAGRWLSGASGGSLRRDFIAFAYALAPLGLAAWVAFSLAFVFANLSYVWVTLSDPLGWGWNLLGTVGLAWTPYLTGVTPILQVGVLVGGLAWASRTVVKIAGERLAPAAAWRAGAPVLLFCLAVRLGLLGLLIA